MKPLIIHRCPVRIDKVYLDETVVVAASGSSNHIHTERTVVLRRS